MAPPLPNPLRHFEWQRETRAGQRSLSATQVPGAQKSRGGIDFLKMPKQTRASRIARPTAGNPEIAEVQIFRCGTENVSGQQTDFLAREEPLEIRVRGQSVAITMRTPGRDAELAVGFLLGEGMIGSAAEVVGCAPCGQGSGGGTDNIWNVFLAPSVAVDFERLTRHVFASSSCGLCGKASIDAVRQQFPAAAPRVTVSVGTLASLPAKLRAAQLSFAQTGGLHAAGLFTARGKLLVLREDVGRHNAVDKVLGHALLAGWLPLDRHVLLVSGRASFEILQKALAAGIGIICAVSAPTSLAVEFARDSGQTLVGFLRGGNMNVYSHPERLRQTGRRAPLPSETAGGG